MNHSSEPVQKETLGQFSTQAVNKAVKPAATDELGKSWNGIFEHAMGLYMNNDQNLSQSQTTEYWRIQNLVASRGLDPANAGAEFQEAEFQKFLDSNK